MHNENLKYLKDNIKYMGFGESLFPELEQQMQAGPADFRLRLENEFNREKLSASLYFRKSEVSGYYFFNRYEASLERQGHTQKSRIFYLDAGRGVTAKEAYNLLSGRAVYLTMKTNEGSEYHAWVQLDFSQKDKAGNFKMKQYHDNYGYQLAAVLTAYPIKEMQQDDMKNRLIQSLQKGNLQAVMLQGGEREQRGFLEANPRFKSLKVFDQDLNQFTMKELVEIFSVRLLSKTQSADLVKAADAGEAQAEGPVNGNTKKKEIAKVQKEETGSLIQIKKARHKKGLGV